MLSLDELVDKAEAYQHNRMSLKDFDQWFEDNVSDENYSAELEELRSAVDAALAAYHFDHIGELAFREDLAAAIRPFLEPVESCAPVVDFVHGKPSIRASVATPARRLRGRAVLSA